MTVPQRPLVRSIPSLAQRLRASEAVIIPTDTLPGSGSFTRERRDNLDVEAAAC